MLASSKDSDGCHLLDCRCKESAQPAYHFAPLGQIFGCIDTFCKIGGINGFFCRSCVYESESVWLPVILWAAVVGSSAIFFPLLEFEMHCSCCSLFCVLQLTVIRKSKKLYYPVKFIGNWTSEDSFHISPPGQ